jgi:hypothetical protein
MTDTIPPPKNGCVMRRNRTKDRHQFALITRNAAIAGDSSDAQVGYRRRIGTGSEVDDTAEILGGVKRSLKSTLAKVRGRSLGTSETERGLKS